MKKTKIIGAIIGVIMFATVIIGLTYAYTIWSSQNINKQVSSKCFNVLYDKGSDIIGQINPSYDYTGGLSTTIRMNMSTRCDVNAKGILYLNTSSDTSENLFREGLLNYHVVRNGNTVIASGNITESGQIAIELGSIVHSQTAYTRYEVYVWIDYSLIENSDVNSVYYGSIKAVAVQEEGEYTPPTTTLIDHITNLYVNNNPSLITHKDKNGNIIADYYYSYMDEERTWGLMNDGLGATVNDTTALVNGTEGNIRYYGKNPNNYIYFNCDDYINQSESTCEKWRIVGIVDGKVKMVKFIGVYYWPSMKQFGNNWYDSPLQNDLNNKYYMGETTQLLGAFHNSNMVMIKNDDTRNMISESTWYLGGHDSHFVFPNDIYSYERGNEKCSGCTYDTTWIGKVALLYPSDAAYSADLSVCNRNLISYQAMNKCYGTGWLISTNSYNLITPDTSDDIRTWKILASNIGISDNDDSSGNIYVTLYLNNEILLDDIGDGSYDDPYQILDF